MNEVEKMYRNSGIKECNRLLKPCPFGNECDDCEHHWYPEFTAEKQLELIKWLSKDDVVRIEKYTLSGETFYELACTFNDWYDDYKYSYTTERFEECLAGLVNYLWQDLTEEKCKQIKNILESEVME